MGGGESDTGTPVQVSLAPRHFNASSSDTPEAACCGVAVSLLLFDVGSSVSQQDFAAFAQQQQPSEVACFSRNRCNFASASTYCGGVTLFFSAQANFSAIDMQQQSRQHCSAEWQPQR
jgi:hypothetical protein